MGWMEYPVPAIAGNASHHQTFIVPTHASLLQNILWESSHENWFMISISIVAYQNFHSQLEWDWAAVKLPTQFISTIVQSNKNCLEVAYKWTVLEDVNISAVACPNFHCLACCPLTSAIHCYNGVAKYKWLRRGFTSAKVYQILWSWGKSEIEDKGDMSAPWALPMLGLISPL